VIKFVSFGLCFCIAEQMIGETLVFISVAKVSNEEQCCCKALKVVKLL
jgi:hypothetical protein